jgi:hypothetical protein
MPKEENMQGTESNGGRAENQPRTPESIYAQELTAQRVRMLREQALDSFRAMLVNEAMVQVGLTNTSPERLPAQ